MVLSRRVTYCGNLTKCFICISEIIQWKTGYEGEFEAYDTDNNRKITRSEVTALMELTCGLDVTKAELDAMFEAADKDSEQISLQ